MICFDFTKCNFFKKLTAALILDKANKTEVVILNIIQAKRKTQKSRLDNFYQKYLNKKIWQWFSFRKGNKWRNWKNKWCLTGLCGKSSCLKTDNLILSYNLKILFEVRHEVFILIFCFCHLNNYQHITIKKEAN